MPEPSPALMLARRILDHVAGVRLLGDWEWIQELGLWKLHCRLHIPDASEYVAQATEWHVLVSPEYPRGAIKCYPAQEGGIRATFPHQAYNGHQSDAGPWRSGALCLDTTVKALGRSGLDAEPPSAPDRLRWHMERALQWTAAAAEGRLVLPGEPYELPQFPIHGTAAVAFSESGGSLPGWNDSTVRAGAAEFAVLEGGRRTHVIRRHCDLQGNPVYETSWGDAVLNGALPAISGFWLRLDAVPVLPPYQAPATWGELRTACRLQGLDLDVVLQRIARHCRGGNARILSLGFPIPAVSGGPASRMHWQALMLPPLTRKGTPVRGFRPGERGYWVSDCFHILHNNAIIAWMRSEDWDKDEITTRGRLPAFLADRDVLLIGAGALGAPVAQMLLRSGVRSLVIVDPDVLDVGNLTRHTLSLAHLGHSKAHALASELRGVSPHAYVESFQAAFPALNPEALARAARCDLILDCTGEDQVIAALEAFPWKAADPAVCSLSLGMEARRLFCYSAPAARFCEAGFRQALAPWLVAQAQEYAGRELPREGIGCWHPVFPARADDVWLLAAAAVKEIEGVLGRAEGPGTLTVVEQTYDEEGSFSGLRRLRDTGGCGG